jgi:predicted transcriptional regulator
MPDKENMQQTTLDAIPSLDTREAQNETVYQYIKNHPNCTMKEVAKETSIPINTITWRFKDLREDGKLINSKTGREMMWSVR